MQMLATMKLTILFSTLLSFYANASGDCAQEKTVDIEQCNEGRYNSKNKTLEALYETKSNSLSNPQKSMLAEVNKSWTDYRDSECMYIYNSILPGAEAGIERFVCLWKLTDDRIKEVRRLMIENNNDTLSNYTSALRSIGYSQDDIINKLSNRPHHNPLWETYINSNCTFLKEVNSENQKTCRARVNAQRGRY